MSNEVEVKLYRDPSDMSTTIAAKFHDRLSESAAYTVLRLVCEKIAERYVEEHYQEIAAKLNPEAIANLAVADAGKKIAEEIRTRPVVIREPGNRTTVNKFSLL